MFLSMPITQPVLLSFHVPVFEAPNDCICKIQVQYRQSYCTVLLSGVGLPGNPNPQGLQLLGAVMANSLLHIID